MTTMTAVDLPTRGPNGAIFTNQDQMANLLNRIRKEHREQPVHTDDVVMGGTFRFGDRTEHSVMYYFRHPGKGFVGAYDEELVVDGVGIGSPQQRAHAWYTDTEGNKQPGWSKPDFFAWVNHERPF